MIKDIEYSGIEKITYIFNHEEVKDAVFAYYELPAGKRDNCTISIETSDEYDDVFDLKIILTYMTPKEKAK